MPKTKNMLAGLQLPVPFLFSPFLWHVMPEVMNPKDRCILFMSRYLENRVDFKGKIQLNPGEAVPNSALSSQEKRYDMFRKEQNNAKIPWKFFAFYYQIPLTVTSTLVRTVPANQVFTHFPILSLHILKTTTTMSSGHLRAATKRWTLRLRPTARVLGEKLPPQKHLLNPSSHCFTFTTSQHLRSSGPFFANKHARLSAHFFGGRSDGRVIQHLAGPSCMCFTKLWELPHRHKPFKAHQASTEGSLPRKFFNISWQSKDGAGGNPQLLLESREAYTPTGYPGRCLWYLKILINTIWPWPYHQTISYHIISCHIASYCIVSILSDRTISSNIK